MSNPNPTWTSQNTGQLVRMVQGVCMIRQATAEQLVAELIEAETDARVVFETQNSLVGKPRTSRVTVTWELYKKKTGGEWPTTRYVLERTGRSAGLGTRAWTRTRSLGTALRRRAYTRQKDRPQPDTVLRAVTFLRRIRHIATWACYRLGSNAGQQAHPGK